MTEEIIDTTLVCELSDTDFENIRFLMDKSNYDLDVLVHYMIDWCFHSSYFWKKYVFHK